MAKIELAKDFKKIVPAKLGYFRKDDTGLQIMTEAGEFSYLFVGDFGEALSTIGSGADARKLVSLIKKWVAAHSKDVEFEITYDEVSTIRKHITVNAKGKKEILDIEDINRKVTFKTIGTNIVANFYLDQKWTEFEFAKPPSDLVFVAKIPEAICKEVTALGYFAHLYATAPICVDLKLGALFSTDGKAVAKWELEQFNFDELLANKHSHVAIDNKFLKLKKDLKIEYSPSKDEFFLNGYKFDSYCPRVRYNIYFEQNTIAGVEFNPKKLKDTINIVKVSADADTKYLNIQAENNVLRLSTKLIEEHRSGYNNPIKTKRAEAVHECPAINTNGKLNVNCEYPYLIKALNLGCDKIELLEATQPEDENRKPISPLFISNKAGLKITLMQISVQVEEC